MAGLSFSGPQGLKTPRADLAALPAEDSRGGPWRSPVGACGSLWVQFWATLAFQSVTDGSPEQFWDTARLNNLNFLQFVAHLGAFWGPLLVIFLSPEPLKPMFFLSKTSIFRKSWFSASGGVLTTFLVTLGWLGPLLCTIFDPPGHSLERLGHSRGSAGAPQEGI